MALRDHPKTSFKVNEAKRDNELKDIVVALMNDAGFIAGDQHSDVSTPFFELTLIIGGVPPLQQLQEDDARSLLASSWTFP
jgi:hypothetical protein